MRSEVAGRAWVGIDCSLPIPAQECSVFTAQELEHQMKPVEPDSEQAKGSGSSW